MRLERYLERRKKHPLLFCEISIRDEQREGRRTKLSTWFQEHFLDEMLKLVLNNCFLTMQTK